MTAPETDMPPSPTTVVKLNAPVIRFALRVLGWSQAELARRVGVHESTISRALREDSTTIDVAQDILAAFGGRLFLQEIIVVPGFSPGLPEGATDLP